EAGRPDDAVDELLIAASMQLDSLDGEAAARSLQEVLNIDPANQRAIHTLRELGYDVPEGGAEAEPEAEAPAQRGGQDGYDADAPLPSYDLEEMGPEDVSQHYSDRRIPIAGPTASIDDPFQTDSPLPSFPLEAPESDPAFDLVPGRAARSAPPASGSADPIALQHRPDESETTIAMSGRQHEDAGMPRSIGPSGAPIPELEDALEEADFFASRGLYDDARAILTEQLSRLPSHPLLRERMQDLDAQEHAAAQASGTRAMPVRGGGEEDDRSFDIAASLDALESLEGDAPGRQTTSGETQSEVDVEEVFAQFKEGVSKQLAPEDSAAHYDMGIAYKEIGRHDDAIKEFEIAARDPEKTCVCEAVIGTIHLERNNVSEAIQAFLRGLNAPVRTAEQEMVLSFELGAAYELKKMHKDALAYFQRVARREPNYRDVKERVRRLSKLVPETTAPQRAVGADDDFDRAFEEIIGSGKLP
ncbi:MAG: tetratricopeptide repeat protein, partial [Polyangiaceae bacterium]